jgi:16S rRNA (guanine966-N2)-methyltransferase
VRVIAGAAKGRTLVVPKGGGTRAATDRIRESLFGILEPDLPDARVLDLFAGAGTLGIEALSRGAAHATFVERSNDALAALRANLRATAFEAKSDIVPANVLAYLQNRLAVPYQIAFCDPPFADVAVMEAVLARLPEAGALAPAALVVARVLKKHRPTLPDGANLVRTKELGEEALLFLRYDAAGGGG